MAATDEMPIRIATWNLQQRTGDAAARLGSLVEDMGGADVVMLQEVSSAGLPRFCEAAGLSWWVDLRTEFRDLLTVRGRRGGRAASGEKHPNARAVAIAGRGPRMRGATAFPDLPLPEKVIAGWVDVGGVPVTLVSYHAPTGAQHKARKASQAVRIARWLTELQGPVVLAGDFNTPSSDPPVFENVRTHWHTGHKHLDGEPGDDLLVGPAPVHALRDALRTFLAAHPERLATIAGQWPDGPLDVSYCTGTNPLTRHRYDAVWLSEHFRVGAVTYNYDASRVAGSDHALVIVDASLRPARAVDVQASDGHI